MTTGDAANTSVNHVKGARTRRRAEHAAHLWWFETAVNIRQILVRWVLKVKCERFCEAFSMVCENDARRHELGQDLEQLWIVQHTLFHARVEKRIVMSNHLVDVAHIFEPLHHCVPVWFDHLEHHIIQEVVQEM